jgi:hypothetical protein
MDLVRNVLLAIESSDKPNLRALLETMSITSKEDLAALTYHLDMLIDQARLVSGINAHSMGGKNWLNLEITWAGHEFLDAIRDSEIWRQTKAGVDMAGGFSVDLISSLAKGFLKKKIEKHTGVELDI